MLLRPRRLFCLCLCSCCTPSASTTPSSCTPSASSTPSSCLALVVLALARTPAPRHPMTDTKLRSRSRGPARARTGTHTRTDPRARARAVAAASLRAAKFQLGRSWLHGGGPWVADDLGQRRTLAGAGARRPPPDLPRRYLKNCRRMIAGPIRNLSRRVPDTRRS